MENLIFLLFDIPLILVWVALFFVRPVDEEINGWMAAAGLLVSPVIYFVLFMIFTEQYSVRIIDQNTKSLEKCVVNCTLENQCPLYFWSVHRQGITDSNGTVTFRFFPFQSPKAAPQTKGGYTLNLSAQQPDNSQTNLKNSVVFTMWKLRGSELLTGASVDAKIPNDGSSVIFETVTGKKSPNGDLRVTLSQYPLEIKKGWERFDWSIKVEVLNGGLVEENDTYPYWAPTDGYQPSFEFNESTNAAKWLGGIQKKFYIKTAQNQYGVMQFKIYPGRSPTGIEANITLNPSGSQNLEPAQER